ncbi:hypothetical protein EW146_g5574 [Bondarzewia mesenterica]|nr:hypothetical protein EW146_g5574 [Bondarzewia mesenterica]
MTKIGANYHANLQQEQQWTNERAKATKNILNNITTKLSEEDKNTFASQIGYEETLLALKASQNGKAPGLDGIPYEFYKKWTKYEDDEDEIDVLAMLSMVYEDVETHGIMSEEWTQGVMCLLYKKKDKRRIENYRPVTLVNTDYKILTKAIATRLGKIAPSLIHKNQNGFIPGRGLYDATRTSQMMLEYCE